MEGDFEIAGWSAFQGDWHDVENGDTPYEDSDVPPWDVEQVTYHYTADDGTDVYFTIDGPFADYDDLMEAIADSLDSYGIE